MRWNAYVHRLDLGLYSHAKEFWGNGVRTLVNSRQKNPLYRKKVSSEEDQNHDATSSRTVNPTHYNRLFPRIYLL